MPVAMQGQDSSREGNMQSHILLLLPCPKNVCWPIPGPVMPVHSQQLLGCTPCTANMGGLGWAQLLTSWLWPWPWLQAWQRGTSSTPGVLGNGYPYSLAAGRGCIPFLAGGWWTKSRGGSRRLTPCLCQRAELLLAGTVLWGVLGQKGFQLLQHLVFGLAAALQKLGGGLRGDPLPGS